jgi:hypothetical protein
MTQTLTPPVSTKTRTTATGYLLGAAATLAGMLLLASTLADAPRADITIVNDSTWDLRVDAVYADGGVVPLATVDADRSQAIEDVWKPSGSWQFRWTYGDGDTTETVSVSDQVLQSGKGRIQAPEGLTNQLRESGVPASP